MIHIVVDRSHRHHEVVMVDLAVYVKVTHGEEIDSHLVMLLKYMMVIGFMLCIMYASETRRYIMVHDLNLKLSAQAMDLIIMHHYDTFITSQVVRIMHGVCAIPLELNVGN